MEHEFLKPIKIGNQTVKNRVFLLAMARCMSDMFGTVSLEDIAYIRSFAEGGAGMVIPGAMVVDPTWPSTLPMQFGIYDDKFIPGLKILARNAHEGGAKILFQLWHPGQVDYTGGHPRTINELSTDEIHEIQQKFFAGARRAMEADADGVEFQTCHSYLANQFISPLWNKRTDEYGYDTLENRTRFAVECISGIREIIGPDKILAVKMQGFDFPKGEGVPIYGADGIQPEDAALVAPYLEKAGADMLTVSAGGSLTRDDIMTGDGHRAEGWKVPAAALVKAAVHIPVAASGSIRHPDYIDEIIREGKCDMVGMGRGLFAEREFVNKCAAGKEDQLRYCMSCMQCGNYGMTPDTSICSVNPFATRERSKLPLKENGNGRVVAIVGAGPAGMEAAITLKQRGFEPVVFEKDTRIGGNMNVAKKPPNKYKFQWQIDYFANMARDLKIDMRLGTEATVENILALNPYSVLIAAGSDVTQLPVEGLENALQSRELLDKDMQFTGKKIAIIGGGITGLETALYLKEQGNEVHVVDFATELPAAPGTDPRYMIEGVFDLTHCKEQGVELHYENKVLKYADGKLYLESVAEATAGQTSEIEADMVVLSTGVKPMDALYTALKETGHPNVWKVGDANVPSKIFKATQAGSKFAYGLN